MHASVAPQALVAPTPPLAASRRRRRLIGGAALLAYLAITLFLLHVPFGALDTRIASDLGDPVFNLYLMQWGARQIDLGMPSFWHAPMFLPARWATTFSDHMLVPAGLCSFGSRLGVAPLLTYNWLVIASFVLSGWMCFWVFRRCGLGTAAAFLGGCIFAFSPFRFDQLPHLAMLLMAWIPPTLWAFDRLLARPSGRRAAVFLAFYALHVLGGNYLAYMIHLPLAAVLANRLLDSASRQRARARLGLLSATAVACASLLIGLLWPYWVASRELGLHRTVREMLQYAASLASYFASTHTTYAAWLPRALLRPENSLFAGFVASVLAILALIALARRLRTGIVPAISVARRAAFAGLLALGLAGVVLGEALVWRGGPVADGRPYLPLLCILAAIGGWLALRRRWRLPARFDWRRLPLRERGWLAAGGLSLAASLGYVFVPLAVVLPGLSGMRVPARFYAFASLAIAFLAAQGYDRLRSRIPARLSAQAAAFAGLLALLWLDLRPVPPDWPMLPEIPGVYTRVASDPAVHAILELPFATQDDADNIVYLYFQTAHWKPLVNGYSGFLPPGYAERRERLVPFPDAAGLAELRALGVTHIVVHQELMPRWQRRAYQAWLRSSGLSEVSHSGRVALLSLGPIEHPTAAPRSHPSVP